MSRIPTHTVDDAPQACRDLLENVIQFSPTGRPLNLHGQMAHSPAVLVAYTSLRRRPPNMAPSDRSCLPR